MMEAEKKIRRSIKDFRVFFIVECASRYSIESPGQVEILIIAL